MVAKKKKKRKEKRKRKKERKEDVKKKTSKSYNANRQASVYFKFIILIFSLDFIAR